jgi:DNA-binding SARP family transcriptional activator
LAKPWKTPLRGKLPLRLYLTGRLTAELGDKRVDDRRLPGRQGRRALVFLALERARPVPIDELADAVWGTSSPSGGTTAPLSSRVRL